MSSGWVSQGQFDRFSLVGRVMGVAHPDAIGARLELPETEGSRGVGVGAHYRACRPGDPDTIEGGMSGPGSYRAQQFHQSPRHSPLLKGDHSLEA